MAEFDCRVDDAGVTLRPRREERGLLRRLMSRRARLDLAGLSAGDARLILALAELHMLAEDEPGSVEIGEDSIRLSHPAAAALDTETATAIGLPPAPDLTFRTDAEGIVGNDGFRLVYEWVRGGRREATSRTGAILNTRLGPRRLPAAILTAIEIADAQRRGDEADDWAALARFRRALEPEHAGAAVDRIAMTDFLSGLEVHLAGELVDRSAAGREQVRLRDRPACRAVGRRSGRVGTHRSRRRRRFAALPGPGPRARRSAGVPAGRGSYLVVDTPLRPVLDVMARMKRAPAEERDAFVRNPLPAITEAVEADLDARGELEGLSAADREESSERAAGRSFIETEGYAERVLGVGTWRRDAAEWQSSGTPWLPEIFGQAVKARVADMSVGELSQLRQSMQRALDAGETSVPIGGQSVPVDGSAVAALDAEIDRRRRQAEAQDIPPGEDSTAEPEDMAEGPQVLITAEDWEPTLAPRASELVDAVPRSIRTDLHPHQIEAFA